MNNRANAQFVIKQFDRSIDIATEYITGEIIKPKHNEVLVKTQVVGINAIYDRELYRGGVPYINVEFPYVFGVESVGEVIEVGSEVLTHQPGDKVSVVKVGSAYQEYQTIPASLVTRIPEATPEYLAINPTGISAHLAIEKVGEVRDGETVMVTAAAGGLGHFIIQLCKMKNCHVIATCGHDEKVEMLQQLDCCDRIIQYKNEDVASVLSQEYNSKIDVAFDSVGGPMFDAILPQLANKGRLVICGLAAELGRPAFEKVHGTRVYEQMYWKGASVRCFMNHLFKEAHPWSREILTDHYQSGRLKILIDDTIFSGVSGIGRASNYLLAGKSRGKVVVRL